MCYMTETIGVRDLRQNASTYLDRVAAGEVFEITNWGRPVARLIPLDTDQDWADLIAAGEVTPARRPRTDLLTHRRSR